MGHRRKAREYALQALYMYEVARNDVRELVGLSWVDREIPDDIREFSIDLITKTVENVADIDALIKKYTRNWSFERLSLVDMAILRISICAMLFYPDIPVVVTINEGIELGKLYGGENSGQFINGILDSIKNSEIRREDSKKGEPGEKK